MTPYRYLFRIKEALASRSRRSHLARPFTPTVIPGERQAVPGERQEYAKQRVVAQLEEAFWTEFRLLEDDEKLEYFDCVVTAACHENGIDARSAFILVNDMTHRDKCQLFRDLVHTRCVEAVR